MNDLEKTCDWLAAMRRRYQEQIDRIDAVLEHLEGSVREYEVHFQAFWHDQEAVTARNEKLTGAYTEAVRLWHEKNVRNMHRGLPPATPYLCMGELLLPIRADDASLVASKEGIPLKPEDFQTNALLRPETVTTVIWSRDKVPLLVVSS